MGTSFSSGLFYFILLVLWPQPNFYTPQASKLNKNKQSLVFFSYPLSQAK